MMIHISDRVMYTLIMNNDERNFKISEKLATQKISSAMMEWSEWHEKDK